MIPCLGNNPRKPSDFSGNPKIPSGDPPLAAEITEAARGVLRENPSNLSGNASSSSLEKFSSVAAVHGATLPNPVKNQKQGWFAQVGNQINSTLASSINKVKTIITSLPTSLHGVDTNQIVQLKEKMKSVSSDPHYIELFDFINALLKQTLPQSFQSEKKSFFSHFLKTNTVFITQLVEINLALGFINLAEKVAEDKEFIVNYDQQPLLANIIVSICRRTNVHISLEKLATIEAIYLDSTEYNQKLDEIFKKVANEILLYLFPQRIEGMEIGYIKNMPVLVLNYINFFIQQPLQGFLRSSYEAMKNDENHNTNWKASLDPYITNQNLDIITKTPIFFVPELIDTIISSNASLSDEISQTLVDLVPNNKIQQTIEKLKQVNKDLETKNKEIKNLINILKKIDDELKKQNTKILGQPDEDGQLNNENLVKANIEAKQEEQGSLQVEIEGLQKDVQELQHDQRKLQQQQSELKMIQFELEKPLANSMLQSLQFLFSSNDPSVQGLGNFLGTALSNVFLGLLSNGITEVIPTYRVLSPDQLLPELKARWEQKIQDLRFENPTLQGTKTGEKKIKAFWVDFIEKLPLPVYLKQMIIPKLVKEKLVDGKLVTQPLIDEVIINKVMNYASLLKIKDRNLQRDILKEKSGSDFLGDLSEGLAKDLFLALPVFVNDYQVAAEKIYKALAHTVAGTEPKTKQAKELITVYAQRIAEFMAQSPNKKITNENLVELYAGTFNIEIGVDVNSRTKIQKTNYDTLMQHAEEIHAKTLVKTTVTTPTEIVELIKKSLPERSLAFISPSIEKILIEQLVNFIDPKSHSFVAQNGVKFAQGWIEGLFLQIFIQMANKYPAQKNTDGEVTKNTINIAVHSLLQKIEQCYQEARINPDYNLVDAIQTATQEVIELTQIFPEFPDLQYMLVQLVNNKIKDFFIDPLKAGLADFKAKDVKKAQTDLRELFGQQAAGEAKSVVDHFVENLVNSFIDSAPYLLLEKGETGQLNALYATGKGLDTYLEQLMQQHSEVAKVLLNYSGTSQLQTMIQVNLAKIISGEAPALPADLSEEQIPQALAARAQAKQQAVEFVSQMILVPINRVINQTLEFEQKTKKTQFLPDLVTKLAKVSADHVKTYNLAKKKSEKVTQVSFTQATAEIGQTLHSAVPEQAKYEKSLEYIKECIKPSMLNEEQAESIRQKLDKLVFLESEKKGKIQSAAIMKAIQEGLLPSQLDAAAIEKLKNETATNPYSDIEGGKKISLKELIRREGKTPEITRQSNFYYSTSKQVLKLVFPNGKEDLTFIPKDMRPAVWKQFKNQLMPIVLPMITEMLLDPKTTTGAILKGLHATKQFLDKPIEMSTLPTKPKEALRTEPNELDKSLGSLCEEMMQMMPIPSLLKNQLIDPKTGKLFDNWKIMIGSTLQEKLTNLSIKDELAAVFKNGVETGKKSSDEVAEAFNKPFDIKQRKAEIKQEMRYVLNSGISYGIRKQWKEAQAQFNDLIKSLFGNIGTKLKKALDAVFHFIFFKIVKSILDVLWYPIKIIAKEALYKYLRLDAVVENLTDFLAELPADQVSSAHHIVYHENLVYKIVDELQKIVNDEIKKLTPAEAPRLPA
jgi:hypothetical protein